MDININSKTLITEEEETEESSSPSPSELQKNLHKCDICTRDDFLNHYWLSEHRATVHDLEFPYKCTLCPESFRNNPEYKSHLQATHPADFIFSKKTRKSNNVVVTAIPLAYSCPHCPKRFTSKIGLTGHIPTHTVKVKPVKVKPVQTSHVCETCKSEFKTAAKLRHHRDVRQRCQAVLERRAALAFECEDCGYKCRQKYELARHLRSVHGAEPAPAARQNRPKLDYICLFCGYDAGSPSLLESHNRYHTRERPVVCDGCQSRFFQKYSLRKHYRSCPKAQELGLVYPVQNMGRPRRKVKDPSMPSASDRDPKTGLFNCSTCSLSLTTNPSRIEHEKIHGSDFMCPFCPVGFNTCMGLIKHKVRLHPKEHAEVREYFCPHCKLSFPTQSLKIKHLDNPNNCAGRNKIPVPDKQPKLSTKPKALRQVPYRSVKQVRPKLGCARRPEFQIYEPDPLNTSNTLNGLPEVVHINQQKSNITYGPKIKVQSKSSTSTISELLDRVDVHTVHRPPPPEIAELDKEITVVVDDEDNILCIDRTTNPVTFDHQYLKHPIIVCTARTNESVPDNNLTKSAGVNVGRSANVIQAGQEVESTSDPLENIINFDPSKTLWNHMEDLHRQPEVPDPDKKITPIEEKDEVQLQIFRTPNPVTYLNNKAPKLVKTVPIPKTHVIPIITVLKMEHE